MRSIAAEICSIESSRRCTKFESYGSSSWTSATSVVTVPPTATKRSARSKSLGRPSK